MTSSKGGRPSHWISSSKTRLIRVPDYMADEILELAKLKDKGESLSFVQNSEEDNKLEKIVQLMESYKLRSHPTSERWKLLNKFIRQLDKEINTD